MKNFITLTDQQLITLFNDGESYAMEILVGRHKDRIFTSIYLLVKDKYLAEDIFQDLFIKIIETFKAGKYKEENKFAQWAMRIGHNLCVDHFRKIKSKPVIRTSEGANILVYAGHGGVAVFCVTGQIVEGDVIQRDLKLHKNAIVIFNHACESAGTSLLDTKDIGQIEALRRVGDYAKPFIASNVSVYYANNYSDCLIPFFTSLFERKPIKEIHNKQATEWNKIEARKK